MKAQNAKIGKAYKVGDTLDSGSKHITVVNQEITVGQLRRGNASIDRWHQALRHAESLINPNRRYLVELLHDVSIDPVLGSLLEKRTGAIQLAPFEWHGLENEAIKEHFDAPWFVDMLGQIMDTKYKGHNLIQVAVRNGEITDTEPIPRQNVIPEKKLITYQQYGEEGFRYDEDPYNKYIMELGKPKDFGILAKIAPYLLMKRDNFAFFMTHNELFGMPLRTYYYNPNDPKSRQQTVDAAEAQGAAAYIVLPETARVEFQAAQSASAGSSPYQILHRMFMEEITISILGQTLTTSTEGKGSNALGRIHKDVEESINLMDMLYVEMVLNYKFKKKILIPHGYPMDGIKGSFTKTERLSQEQKLKIWDTIGKDHAPIDFEAWYEEFGVPHPDDQGTIDRFIQSKSSGQGTGIKEMLDAYGVGVRAGAITPQIQDEQEVRKILGLGELSSEVKRSWKDDEGVRRPITLKGQDRFEAEETRAKEEAKKAAQKQDQNTELSIEAQKKKMIQLYQGLPTGMYTLVNEDVLDKAWDQIIKDLHAGKIPSGSANAKLAELYASTLFDGVQKGYGRNLEDLRAGAVDDVMLSAMRENIYIFSAFKSYQALEAARNMLLNDDGSVKAFQAFRDEVLSIHQDYNINWLRTEYNMAIGQAQMAARWKMIEQDKAYLPYLKFRSVLDDRARHRQYNGITRPVDDPIWDYLTPLLDYGCRCTLSQHADGDPTPANNIPGADLFKEEFRFNPGKSKIIFNKNHPYFNVQQQHVPQAQNRFGLTTPEVKRKTPDFRFKSAAEARKFILDNKLAGKVTSFFSALSTETATLITRALYDNFQLSGRVYDEIKASRSSRAIAVNRLFPSTNVQHLEISASAIENTAMMQRAFKNKFFVAENAYDIINHEFGHFLTRQVTFAKARKMNQNRLPDAYRQFAITEYAKTNIDETLAEIYAGYRKKDPRITTAHIDFFNKYSIIQLKP